MVQKKLERSVFFCVATYGNGHKENTDLRNCSRFSKHCTKPSFEDEIDAAKEDQITATTVMTAIAAADEHYDKLCI